MSNPSSVPTSISFAGALLFDDKANFVVVTSGSTFNVTQSYFPVAGAGDNGKALPLSIASGSLALRVSQVGSRNVIGEYGVATALITGAASAQNLLSIENPVGSGVQVIVKKMTVGGVVNAVATTIFLYRMGRNNTFPTGGTTVTATKRETDDPSPVAIVRSAPAGSITNTMWSAAPGVVLGTLAATAVSFVPNVLCAINSDSDTQDIVLQPGEALILLADTNTTGWRHYVTVGWQEAL